MSPYSPPVQGVRSVGELVRTVVLRLSSVVLNTAVECSPPEEGDLLLAPVRQVVALQPVGEAGPVLGVDESHVLTEESQPPLVFLGLKVPLVLLFELLKAVVDVSVVVVNELLHGVHGVGVVHTRPRPAMAIFLEENVKDMGVVQHLGPTEGKPSN